MTAVRWLARSLATTVAALALGVLGVYGAWFAEGVAGVHPTTPRTAPIYVQYVPPSNIVQPPLASTPSTTVAQSSTTPTTAPGPTYVQYVAPPATPPTTDIPWYPPCTTDVTTNCLPPS